MEPAHPPIIASKLRQTVIIHAVEGKRQREWGWKKEQRGGLGTLHGYQGCLGCDGRWQLFLTSEYPTPFFGPCWGTVTAQTLSLHLPGPAERPSPLASAFATGSPWDVHQDYRIGLWRSLQTLTISRGCLAGGVSPGPHTQGAQKW